MNRMKTTVRQTCGSPSGDLSVLAVFSVSCALDHGQQSSGHHHGGTVSHSSFCAWACQANPMSDVGPSAIVMHPLFLASPASSVNHTVIACDVWVYAASRAPPVQVVIPFHIARVASNSSRLYGQGREGSFLPSCAQLCQEEAYVGPSLFIPTSIHASL